MCKKNITCYRCKGEGVIDSYLHISQGVCFLCNGAGVLPEKSKNNKGFSASFLKTYQQDSFPPADFIHLPVLRVLSGLGCSYEERLLKDGTHYYICKPICRASIWYAIPIEDFMNFKTHYEKIMWAYDDNGNKVPKKLDFC